MSGFPQLTPVFRFARPLEIAAAIRVGEGLHHFRLLGNFRLVGAVKFKEESRGNRQHEPAVGVGGSDLCFVEKLDASDGNAALEQVDSGFHGGSDVGESANGGGDKVGERVEANGGGSDDA